jgi:hypothetical protein
MTLVEFLDARIAEEEAEARQAFDDLDLDGTGTGWSTSLGYDHNQLSGPGYVFTRRWSPERVLAECEAKRQIIEEHGGRAPYFVDPCDAHDAEFKTIPCDTARFLAAVYADHPDYREEWKVDA